MGLLEYNEIREKRHVVIDGEPYEVIDSHVFRKQQRKPVNQVKMRHLVSGRVIERSFGSSEKAEEADITKKNITFLYIKPAAGNKPTEYWFSAENNPGDRFQLSAEMVAHALPFMKPNSVVEGLVFNEEIVSISLSPKVDLKVTEAAPAVKGNTATGATKQVVLETGHTITTPLFINEGDIVRISTATGEYTERVTK